MTLAKIENWKEEFVRREKELREHFAREQMEHEKECGEVAKHILRMGLNELCAAMISALEEMCDRIDGEWGGNTDADYGISAMKQRLKELGA